MSVNTRLIEVGPDRVWDVLADGWLFPLWVVGASRIRDVDESWPAPNSRLHHSIGVWPCLIDDETKVVESSPGARLVLLARGWPAGEARVIIDLTASGANTQVTLTESAVSGPGRMVPRAVLDPALTWRNTETLRRLALVAQGRHS